jgi:hypothetical protein
MVKVIKEYLIGNHEAGSDRGLFEYYVLEFASKGLGKPIQISIRIFRVRADIRDKRLQNICNITARNTSFCDATV